jgi:hypothetical protein
LAEVMRELVEKGFIAANMLVCRDGTPILDMQGLLDDPAMDE